MFSLRSLSFVLSPAPSPLGSISRSPAETVGGRPMRARVAHQPGGSKPTLLPFFKGEMITVLVQQPKNGWLYGRADSTSQWVMFPCECSCEWGGICLSRLTICTRCKYVCCSDELFRSLLCFAAVLSVAHWYHSVGQYIQFTNSFTFNVLDTGSFS